MAESATAVWIANNRSPGFPASPPIEKVVHTRTYQACVPCRQRKVRCDLGPVDKPHEPPCVRCRRESKECYFSVTRKKRRNGDGEGDEEDVRISDVREARNGRKRLRADWAEDNDGHFVRPVGQYSAPYTKGQSTATRNSGPFERVWQSMRHQTSEQAAAPNVEDQRDIERAAAVLQSREVFSGHDALHLLAEASRRNADMPLRAGSIGSVQRGQSFAVSHSFDDRRDGSHLVGSPQDVRTGRAQSVQPQRHSLLSGVPAIDPAIAEANEKGGKLEDEEAEMHLAIQAWSRFRFVRAGWFTAKEGIGYIDYFYKFLCPLTPVTVPDFHDPSTHGKLLSQEPMLAVTILMISSRYMTLAGPGASTRLHFIHGKLWCHLEGMIARMMWGQERFGGAFSGAGAKAGSDVDPLSRKGLRTLGTVESLLLLTEWHPQALHFPQGDDSDELMASEGTATPLVDDEEAAGATVQENAQPGIGGKRIDSWLEPCWRSDRMCWMLLGLALSLSYEIGVFDESSIVDIPQDKPSGSPEALQAYCRRRNNVKELLLIYITQTSGRLGLTSMLPRTFNESSLSIKTPAQRFDERMTQLLRANSQDGAAVARMNDGLSATERVQGTVLYFWLEISSIMKTGNQQLFPSRKYTRDIIKSGRYVDLLQQFQPALQSWRRDFDQCDNMPLLQRHILTIEYEYCRVYLNSLALQAVIERCTNNTPDSSNIQLPTAHNPDLPQIMGRSIPFSTLRKWLRGDQQYVNEVVDASRSLLQVVVNGLFPGDYLKHSPVRTYFRIISVALILFKTFVLGATEDDASLSLGLMDRAVAALRTCIVDDVHVGNRFADLLHILSNRVKSCFVRLAANGPGISRAASGSPAPPFENQTGPLANGRNAAKMYGFPSAQPSPPGGTSTPRIPNAYPIYEPSNNNYTLMPPPSFGFTPGYDYNNMKTGTDTPMDENGNFSDWLALPLDPLLNFNSADVTQTSYGPDVGGYDLLELLLSGQAVDGLGNGIGS